MGETIGTVTVAARSERKDHLNKIVQREFVGERELKYSW